MRRPPTWTSSQPDDEAVVGYIVAARGIFNGAQVLGIASPSSSARSAADAGMGGRSR